VYQEQQGFFCSLPAQAFHLRRTLKSFASMREEDDPFNFALANFYMGLSNGYIQNVKTSIRLLRRSVEVVRRNGIRFVPISSGDACQQHHDSLSSIPEFSEDVHERAAFLSQMLYTESFLFLAGQPGEDVCFFDDKLKPVLHVRLFYPSDSWSN
jgi:hypothetical protein